jgi:hypothetical protein
LSCGRGCFSKSEPGAQGKAPRANDEHALVGLAYASDHRACLSVIVAVAQYDDAERMLELGPSCCC